MLVIFVIIGKRRSIVGRNFQVASDIPEVTLKLIFLKNFFGSIESNLVQILGNRFHKKFVSSVTGFRVRAQARFVRDTAFWLGWAVFPASSRCQRFTHVLLCTGGSVCGVLPLYIPETFDCHTGDSVDRPSQSFPSADEEAGLDGEWVVQSQAGARAVVLAPLQPLVKGAPRRPRGRGRRVQRGSHV